MRVEHLKGWLVAARNKEREATWRLVNERVSARRDPEKD